MELEDISKEDFQAYEDIRQSGVVNMLSSQVEDFAGISKEVKVGIMQHYSALNEKWPDIRKS